MKVVGGFQYVTSAGDSGRIAKAKKRIVDALTGLLLALGSYTILYTINPDLVRFEGLQFAAVSTQLLEISPEESFDSGDVFDPNTTPITTTSGKAGKQCGTVDECRSKFCAPAGCMVTGCDATIRGHDSCKVECPNFKVWPTTAPGIIDAKDTKNSPTGTGLVGGGVLVSNQVHDGLVRAGRIADREGYAIRITSGFRTLPKQILLVCKRIAFADHVASSHPEIARKALKGIGGDVAWPGASLHGTGYAADLQLWKKGTYPSGDPVVCSGCCPSQGQDKFKEPSKKFDQIMTEAGAKRYSNEIWHYEFGAPASVQPRCTYPNCAWPAVCPGQR